MTNFFLLNTGKQTTHHRKNSKFFIASEQLYLNVNILVFYPQNLHVKNRMINNTSQETVVQHPSFRMIKIKD